jgi:hypothetical protein
MADKIFVVSANFSGVGKLREFELQHAGCRKGLAARIAPGGAEWNSSVNL